MSRKKRIGLIVLGAALIGIALIAVPIIVYSSVPFLLPFTLPFAVVGGILIGWNQVNLYR